MPVPLKYSWSIMVVDSCITFLISLWRKKITPTEAEISKSTRGWEAHWKSLEEVCYHAPMAAQGELSPLSLSHPSRVLGWPFHLPECFIFNKDLLTGFPSTKWIPGIFREEEAKKSALSILPIPECSCSEGQHIFKIHRYQNQKVAPEQSWCFLPLSPAGEHGAACPLLQWGMVTPALGWCLGRWQGGNKG